MAKIFISFLVGKLASESSVKTDRTRKLWEKDLEVYLGAEARKHAFVSAKKIFICNRLWESQYRILDNVQLTPYFLRKTESPDLTRLCEV